MLDIDFDLPLPGTFCPGDTFTCKIDVHSMFKLKCKYVKVRLRCPHAKSDAEEFRIYEIANLVTADENGKDYQIAGKGLLRVFKCSF